MARWPTRRCASDVLLDSLGGAAAGLLGTYLMSPAMSLAGKLQRQVARQREQEVSGEPSTTKLAVQVLKPFGVTVPEERKALLGQVVHYGYGTTWGAIFGALASRFRRPAWSSGLLLGTGLWLFGDEIVLPALRLSAPPTRYPLSTHVKALAAHLVYGMVTSGAFWLLRSARRQLSPA